MDWDGMTVAAVRAAEVRDVGLQAGAAFGVERPGVAARGAWQN